MITVREASGADVPAIRDIFLACYGTAYPYAQYYDEQALNKLVYSDDTLILVAEDAQSKRVVGTSSVILEVGAYSDLAGEFGRLAVHPDARHHGVGKLLMAERVRRVQDRLQVGMVDARATHPYSMKIAEANGFSVVGFMPLKMYLGQRESLALYVQHFGNGLDLRSNHPRVTPEVHPLAHLALENCGLRPDMIVDEDSPPYPPAEGFQVQELTTEGYAPLLRIERGRVRHREIFGPLRLHYGYFKLQARRSRYLIAREQGRIVGAVGFTLARLEKLARIFELIALHDDVVRFLLGEVERLCRTEWDIAYLDVDVSAYAPRMQRTLLELNFLPVAYIPALAFHEVERLDVVRMARLLVPPAVDTEALTPSARGVAEVVLRQFRSRSVLPRIAQAVQELPLFKGLNAEQVHRLAGVCGVSVFEPGQVIFRAGEGSQEMYVVLLGEVSIASPTSSLSDVAVPVGAVRVGECLGEMSLLTAAPHSATATARTRVEAAVLDHQDLVELIRLRPDVGLHIYKNLAVGMGEKLKRLSVSISGVAQPLLKRSPS
jgi:ribosomal protein S18 acetylase RimI-like enzyme